MKTERRHEMQTNVLADWLGHWIEKLKPYGKVLLLAAAATALLVAVSAFFMNDQAARMSAGWSDFFAASHEANPERLRAVASDHSGTVAGVWAQMTEADLELAQGMRLLYTDRESANKSLNTAKDGYLMVIAADRSDQLRNTAQFGLGQAYECLAQVDDAIDAYKKVANPESALFAQAQARIALLEDADMKQFYNWFANQKPVPRRLTGASPGLGPGGMPANLDILSDQPDLGLSTDFLGGSPLGPTSTADPSERNSSAFDSSDFDSGPNDPATTESGVPSPAETPPADDAP